MEFDPIILRYEGLDADESRIDLGQIGLSLQGASKILGSAGSLVVTGQYARRSPALSIRVLAGTANDGSWEIPAVLVTIAPIVAPYLPTIADITKERASRAVTAIVNFAIARRSRRPHEAEMSFKLAEKSLEEMGRTSRHAIDAMERIAANQSPAMRLFVTPIGESCHHAQIGDADNGAIPIDASVRAAIEGPSTEDQIGPTSTFHIFITELDLRNRSCKFSLRDDDDPDRRYPGDIVDPTLLRPDNPYSLALAQQRWLAVTGKPEIRDGETERLYISDALPSLEDA